MYISAQERVLSIDELFQLADQNSKSIQLHALAIDESAQAVKVAKDARLPSIRAQVDLNYIGDGCMTDRDFSNGIHADMPHFGNTFVLKASQVIYAGGSIHANIQKRNYNTNCPNRLTTTISKIYDSCCWATTWICSNFGTNKPYMKRTSSRRVCW